jgi:type II secretory pathway pseudopilin PulG
VNAETVQTIPGGSDEIGRAYSIRFYRDRTIDRTMNIAEIQNSSAGTTETHGFALVELLVILSVVALLFLTLLPSLASTKGDGRVLQCMNNQKQLTMAWLMYTTENNDRLMPNPGWVAGVMDWTSASDNTNSASLENPGHSSIAEYVRAARLFKCPSDTYQSSANPGPRVRSISLNGVLTSTGSGPAVQGTYPGGRIFYGAGTIGPAGKITDLIKPGPAQVFAFLDEHPDSLNDGTFMFDPGYSPGVARWRDLPGSFHGSFGSLSFADGHFELPRWQDFRTVRNVLYVSWGAQGSQIVGTSLDYEWMVSKMPCR